MTLNKTDVCASRPTIYEVTIDGVASGVIELPIERILDDAPYFGAASGSLPSTELVEQIYRAEFDVAFQEGGLYVLTMHPHYTGTGRGCCGWSG